MPLVRTENKLIYFAHVPKAAGTTIEHYLKARFGALALHDPAFGAVAESERWSQTSPQHMPEATRLRFLPDEFLDASFATVRHPAERLFSAFLFQRDIEANIPKAQKFEAWLDQLESHLPQASTLFDGHIRPMDDFVPATAEVFRIEEGLDPLVHWLDAQSGTTAPDIKIISKNVLKDRLIFQKQPVPTDKITASARVQIARLYEMDYSRFGYDIDPPEQA